MPFLTSIGDNSFRVISEAPSFDPEFGWINVETYEGDEASVKSNAGQAAALGLRVRAFPFSGPVWHLEVSAVPTQAQTGAPEITDQFEFDVDFIQEDIWAAPRILALAGGSEDTLSIWRARIEAEIKKENPMTPSQYSATGVSDEELAIYILRRRGAQATERRRLVLRRVRTLPSGHAGRVTLDGEERIYTTAALIDAFAIPGDVANRLPFDGGSSPPSFSAWSWKVRRDSSVLIPALAKYHETKDWVFAAWSTVEYVLTI